MAKKYKAIGVIDRNVSLGSGGVVYNELRGALYDMDERPNVIGFHTGMAGKEVTPQHINHIAKKTLRSIGEKMDQVEWV